MNASLAHAPWGLIWPLFHQTLRRLRAHSTEVGHRFHVIMGTHFTPSWAAVSRTRAA